MPILPSEPQLYPPDLWERALRGEPLAVAGVLERSEGTFRWMCLHVKPRQEKATARHLRECRVSHYLPQVVNQQRTPGGRIIRSELPLFPGYLFLYGGESERLEALRSQRLVKVLEVPDQEALDRDLRQIHTMLRSGLVVRREASYPVGTRVRIQSGPLRGLVGTVIRRDKHDQFVAVVEMLGCGAKVDLEDWQVERVDGAA